ncbi:unnamed protein product [Brassica oleracea]
MDDHFKTIVIVVIASFLVGGVVLLIYCSICINKKQKLRLPEPPQVQRRMIVSDPTHQQSGTHVDNDRSRGGRGTIVKHVVPVAPYSVDDSLVNKTPKNLGELQGKRDDGGFAVMTAASTSATFCDFGGGGCSSGGCGGCGGGCGG